MINMRNSTIAFLSIVSGGCSTTQQLGTVGQVSGPPDNVKRVSAAVIAANGVYANSKFWDLVAERSWISSADPDRAIPGTEVARSLRQIEPQEQSYSFKRFDWGHLPFIRGCTNASTAQCDENKKQCGHIYVNVKDDDGLNSLVNTIAHENTHVIGSSADDGTICHCSLNKQSAYVDTPDHPIEAEVWMVSYGVGDLAQCFFENGGDREKTWACFATNVDGTPMNRIEIECTKKSNIRVNVLADLRVAAAECSPKK
jgi:hypothetical protein